MVKRRKKERNDFMSQNTVLNAVYRTDVPKFPRLSFCSFKQRKEKSLRLHFFDLTGIFQIDWKKSERILKDVVKIRENFKGLRFDFYDFLIITLSLSKTMWFIYTKLHIDRYAYGTVCNFI